MTYRNYFLNCHHDVFGAIIIFTLTILKPDLSISNTTFVLSDRWRIEIIFLIVWWIWCFNNLYNYDIKTSFVYDPTAMYNRNVRLHEIMFITHGMIIQRFMLMYSFFIIWPDKRRAYLYHSLNKHKLEFTASQGYLYCTRNYITSIQYNTNTTCYFQERYVSDRQGKFLLNKQFMYVDGNHACLLFEL